MTRVRGRWLALALCVPATAAAAPAYVAVPLGSLGGVSTYGTGINSAGQVSGWGDTDGTGAAHRHAFLYANGTISNLGTLNGGTQSFAYALNDAAQVVGSSNGSGIPLHAARFTAGTVTDLTALVGGTVSSAYGINARGDFVGGVSAGGPTHAYRYLASTGMVTDLGTFGGSTSQAYAVNAFGDVTGFAHVPSQDAHAFRYDSGGLIDLGTLGGSSSIGHAIAPNGHVVGESSLPGNAGPHAFLHNGASMIDLGTLGGGTSSALGINAAETIVGESTNAQGQARAFLRDAGGLVDLNTITSGLNGATLTTASAINDAGQIVAMSCTDVLVCPQAFRLDPGVELNQHGLTGSWFNPATDGQGVEVEIFPNFIAPNVGLTQVSWFTFDTAGGADHQRWFTLSGNVVGGQTTASLTIYRNVGGNFNAPPVTNGVAVGTATLHFDSCTSGVLTYNFTDGSGRAGSIPLTRITRNVTCSTTSARPTNPDFALSGNWYDAGTNGQGFTVEVNPVSSAMFFAWYTYAPAGAGAGAAGQRWYTGLSTFSAGMRSIPFTLYETTGGTFDSTATAAHSVAIGTGSLSFQSCTTARLDFHFTGGSSSGTSGSIALTRIGPVPPGCVG